ncbi:sex-determining region Y protein-like isoform X2 [Oncorhynchus keta]|uniref:sex-determining region Y protein-like isoform X2 n=1 Tax=Oncorhynchus keta TaxID=8018 RepID=UPI00227BD973|nr:sex-determining region Y protein-like isoform X2 [Oncorhynchus keta]
MDRGTGRLDRQLVLGIRTVDPTSQSVGVIKIPCIYTAVIRSEKSHRQSSHTVHNWNRDSQQNDDCLHWIPSPCHAFFITGPCAKHYHTVPSYECDHAQRQYHERQYHERQYHERQYHERQYHERQYHERQYHERQYHERQYHERQYHERQYHECQYHERLHSSRSQCDLAVQCIHAPHPCGGLAPTGLLLEGSSVLNKSQD